MNYFVKMVYEDNFYKGITDIIEKFFENSSIEEVEKFINNNKIIYKFIGMEKAKTTFFLKDYTIFKSEKIKEKTF